MLFSHHFSRWRDAEEGIFFNRNARLFFVVAVFADNAIERIAVCSTRNVDIIDEALFQHDSVRYRVVLSLRQQERHELAFVLFVVSFVSSIFIVSSTAVNIVIIIVSFFYHA